MQEDHLLHENVTLERIILCKLTFNQELKKKIWKKFHYWVCQDFQAANLLVNEHWLLLPNFILIERTGFQSLMLKIKLAIVDCSE